MVIVLLAEPIIAWYRQLSNLLGGCADGVGNALLTGRLNSRNCVLFKNSQPVATVPWLEDVLISGLLALALLCVVVALWCPRRSPWSFRLPMIGLPLLLLAVVNMAGRGLRRMGGGAVSEFRIPRRSLRGDGFTRVGDGWTVNLAKQQGLWIPDIGGLALGLSFFAGLVLLILISALLADRYRHRTQ